MMRFLAGCLVALFITACPVPGEPPTTFATPRAEPIEIPEPISPGSLGPSTDESDDFVMSEAVWHNRAYDLPEGYLFLQGSPLGEGGQGVVFLVEAPNGDKKAAKFHKSFKGLESKARFQLDDVDVADAMRKDFQNPMEAEILQTRSGDFVLMKTYIEGSSVTKLMETGEFFDPDIERSFNKFFVKISRSGSIYPDLNLSNLVYSNEHGWVVIDAGPPLCATDFGSAFAGNLESFDARLRLVLGTGWMDYFGNIARRAVGAGLDFPRLDSKGYQAALRFQKARNRWAGDHKMANFD